MNREKRQSEAEVLVSQCWECSTFCGTRVYVDHGRVVKVTGDPSNSFSRGAVCVKGVHGAMGAAYNPDRILHPMRRVGKRGERRWQRISWDEALDEMVDRLGEVKHEYGAEAICGAVSNAYYSRGVAMALLLRSLGAPNSMINQDLCQGCRNISDMVTGLGAPNGEEVDKARCILVVGRSPKDSNIIQWIQIKQGKREGRTTLVVVDPRRTSAAELADEWLQVRPGTDMALALSMAHVIIAEDLYDHDFVENWCYGFKDLARHVARYDPDTVAGITGLAAEDIRRAARLYATLKPAALSLGHGVDSQVDGVQTARAFHLLVALTGNLDVPGGNRRGKRLPGLLTYWDFIHRPEFRLPPDVEAKVIGADRFPLWSGAEGWSKASHNPSVIRAILTGEPYPVRALYVSGVNIVSTYPGTQDTLEALRSLDFLCVAAHDMTPTAELADLVLPKTVTLEEEEVMWQPAGPIVTITPRAMEPLGEARSDIDIASALMDKLRERGLVSYDLFPWKNHRDFNEYLLKDTEYTVDDLLENGHVTIPFEYRDYEENGFKTPTGKLELYSTTLERYGYDPLPTFNVGAGTAASVPDASERFPLVLLTGIRSITYHHSRFRDQPWARRAKPDPDLAIHHEAAAARGILDGDWVLVETGGNGRCKLRAVVSDEVPVEVVATGMGWWYPERPSIEEGRLDSNVNNVISYGPPYDSILGCPDTHGIPCQVVGLEDGPWWSRGPRREEVIDKLQPYAEPVDRAESRSPSRKQ